MNTSELFKSASSEYQLNNGLKIVNEYLKNNNIEDIEDHRKIVLAFVYNILPTLFLKVEKVPRNELKLTYYGAKHILQDIPRPIIPDLIRHLYMKESEFKLVCNMLGYKNHNKGYILAVWNRNFRENNNTIHCYTPLFPLKKEQISL